MARKAAPPEPLVCPGCTATFPAEERFCSECGLPLTLSVTSETFAEVTERQRRARKIKPQLAEGALVRVAWARHQAEGEFIQGLLLEEGIPSVLRRNAGFDVPDFLAGGPRDVLVAQSGVPAARQMLLQAELIGGEQQGPPTVSPGHLLAGLLLALAIGALVVWIGTVIVH